MVMARNRMVTGFWRVVGDVELYSEAVYTASHTGFTRTHAWVWGVGGGLRWWRWGFGCGRSHLVSWL